MLRVLCGVPLCRCSDNTVKKVKMNQQALELILSQNLSTTKNFVKMLFDSLKSEMQELRNENCEIKKSLEFTQDQLSNANKQLEDQAKCTGSLSS